MITVRPATHDDVPWIVSELKKFSDSVRLNGRPLFSDAETVEGQIVRFLDAGHLMLVSDDGTQITGFIAGFIAPHFMNPEIKTLVEVFWWVAEDFRKTRAGLMLLKAYVTFGRANADWVTMNLQEQTMIKERSLTRYGFRLQEITYLMETA